MMSAETWKKMQKWISNDWNFLIAVCGAIWLGIIIGLLVWS